MAVVTRVSLTWDLHETFEKRYQPRNGAFQCFARSCSVYNVLPIILVFCQSDSFIISSSLGVAVACSGTHGYMAPEVLMSGVTYDTFADWWSLGCLIFHMLVGFVI
jgi:serine/threonine protein kinase